MPLTAAFCKSTDTLCGSFSFTEGSTQRKNECVTTRLQQACLFAAVFTAWSLFAAEPRTWTFSQDGQMKTASGGSVSFKKNGRLDAEFVRLETNNVVLRVRHGEYRVIPAPSLSEVDRIYLARLTKAQNPQNGTTKQQVRLTNAASERKVQATVLRNRATARRQLAAMAREAAADLEAQADTLAAHPVDLPAQPQTRPELPSASKKSFAAVSASDEVAVNSSVVTNQPDDAVQEAARLRREAEDKRQTAARMEEEAAHLEEMAANLGTPEPSAQ